MKTRAINHITIKKQTANATAPLSMVVNPLYSPENLEHHGLDIFLMLSNTSPQILKQNMLNFQNNGNEITDYFSEQNRKDKCQFEVPVYMTSEFEYMMRSVMYLLWEKNPQEKSWGKGNYILYFKQPGKAIFLNGIDRESLTISIANISKTNGAEADKEMCLLQVLPQEDIYQLKLVARPDNTEGIQLLNQLLFSMCSGKYQASFYGIEKMPRKKNGKPKN